MKTLKTILLGVTFLSAGLLWWTRDEWLGSLSAFALSDNVLFYRSMHLSMFAFFLINSRFKKYATEYFLALGIGLILVFDMYHHPTIHFWATLLTILLACFTLIVNAESSLNKTFAGFMIGGALTSFACGYFIESFHFLLAEVLCMGFIATGKLKEIYK